MLKKEEAFTLIEMLIVLAIISLLLILVVPNLTAQNEALKKNSEDVLIQMAENQTQAYYLEKGKYPDSIDQLVTEGYLKTDKLSNDTRILVYKNNGKYEVEVKDNVDSENNEDDES